MKKERPTASETVTLSRERYQRLLDKLEESVTTLEAIREGRVDAVVVEGEGGPKVYTLAGADHPYRSYVERMQEGAVTIDRTGLVLYANQQFASLVGQPLSEVIGANLQSYLNKAAWKAIGRVFQERGKAVKRDTLLRAKGGKLQAQVTAGLLSEEDNPLACLVVTDLTSQRENARLQVAKEIAERENATKDAFLAALSHELRTPLTPALISAKMLAEDPTLSDVARKQLATIRRNIELEARLIDDLLDLTRIANGKYSFRPEPVDLRDALELALETCQFDIEQKNHQVELDLRAARAHVNGDLARLQQVFWNLLRNAAKFTPPGGRIRVATENEGDTVRVSISDNGIGIEAERLEQIFAAFEQGGKRFTTRFGGLGLGLAISRAIVDAHDGEISARSAGRKRGSEFTVTLPLTERPAPRAAAPAVASPASPRPQPAGLNVLLVEDNADSRWTMQMLLKLKGHQVTPAETGRAGLKLAGARRYDLLICDIGLPDMTGYEFLRRMRERQPVRAIAVSGYGMENDLAKSRDAGFQRHLTKPVDPASLLEAVDALEPRA